MFKTKRLLFLLVVVCFLSSIPFKNVITAEGTKIEAEVTAVTDGDTFTVKMPDGKKEKSDCCSLILRRLSTLTNRFSRTALRRVLILQRSSRIRPLNLNLMSRKETNTAVCWHTCT